MSAEKVVEGGFSSAGMKFAVVASRFNGFIVDRLVEGAVEALVRTGCDAGAITIVRVPGSFELAQAARKVVDLGGIDAVICIGCVIRGATSHYDHVAGEAARGIGGVAASSPIPVTFGVLTCETIEQAIERAGTKAGNKGFDAAMAAIEMVNLYRVLSKRSK
jgi:6,7-dimethyl-8-ribityllumazine synthase